MTQSEERGLEIIRIGLSYIKADAHSCKPNWDTKYPWIEDPVSPNNRNAIQVRRSFQESENTVIRTLGTHKPLSEKLTE